MADGAAWRGHSRIEIGKDRSLNDHRGNTESKNRFGAHKSHGGIVFDVQDEVRQRLRSECCNQVRHHRRHVFYHDLSSSIRYSPLSGTRSLGSLPGQRGSKLHSPADPLEQRLLAPEAGRSNVYEAGERLARKIHLPGVGLRERFLVACRPNANHQLVIENAATHTPAQQEHEASEHLSLGDSLAPRYHPSDSIGQFFVVGHKQSDPTAARFDISMKPDIYPRPASYDLRALRRPRLTDRLVEPHLVAKRVHDLEGPVAPPLHGQRVGD